MDLTAELEVDERFGEDWKLMELTPAQLAARDQIGVAKLNRLPSQAFGLYGDTPESACDRIEALVEEARATGYVIDYFEMDAAFALRDWPAAEVEGGVLVEDVLLMKRAGLQSCVIVRFGDGSPPCA